MCVDYRQLNKISVPNAYPLPRINHILQRLRIYISTQDLKNGYWQIPVRKMREPHGQDRSVSIGAASVLVRYQLSPRNPKPGRRSPITPTPGIHSASAGTRQPVQVDKQNAAGARQVSRHWRGERTTLSAHWPARGRGRIHAVETMRRYAIPPESAGGVPRSSHCWTPRSGLTVLLVGIVPRSGPVRTMMS